ncbi:hypothetical protein C8Q73DRAFT_781765 [Cubamyces lactineus]|nr:hypothetical protein C8Q73DRAFT_781765 [Cubamyces lactineus]
MLFLLLPPSELRQEVQDVHGFVAHPQTLGCACTGTTTAPPYSQYIVVRLGLLDARSDSRPIALATANTMPSPLGRYPSRVPPTQKLLLSLPPETLRIVRMQINLPPIPKAQVKRPAKHKKTTAKPRTGGRAPPAAPPKDDSAQSQQSSTAKSFSHPHEPRTPTLVETAPAAPCSRVHQQETRLTSEAASTPSPTLSPVPDALPTDHSPVDHRPPTLPGHQCRPIRRDVLSTSQRLLGALADDLAPSDVRLLEQARLLFPLALPRRAIPSLSSVTRPSFTTSYNDGRPLARLPIPLVSGPQTSPEPVSISAPAHSPLVARQERARHRHNNDPINRQSRPLDSALGRRHGPLEDNAPFLSLSQDAWQGPPHSACRGPQCLSSQGFYGPPKSVYTTSDASVYATQTCAPSLPEGVALYPEYDADDDARTPSWASLSPCTADTPLQVNVSLEPATTSPSEDSFHRLPKWQYGPDDRYSPADSPCYTSSTTSPAMSSPATPHGDLMLGFGGGFGEVAARHEIDTAVQATTATPSTSSAYGDESTVLTLFTALQEEAGDEDVSGADLPTDNNVVTSAATHQLQAPYPRGVQDLDYSRPRPGVEQLGALQQRPIVPGCAPQQAKVHNGDSGSASQFISSYSTLSGALGPTWAS